MQNAECKVQNCGIIIFKSAAQPLHNSAFCILHSALVYRVKLTNLLAQITFNAKRFVNFIFVFLINYRGAA